MNMNYSNFENETFEILSGEILCSNFENCTFLDFNGEVIFNKCNIKNCKFKKPCKFVKSTIKNVLKFEDFNKEQSVIPASETAPTLKKRRKKVASTAPAMETSITPEEQFENDKKNTDTAINSSVFEKTLCSTAEDEGPNLHTIDPTKVYFENPQKANQYILVCDNSICRGDNLDNIDLNYANSLVETGMHCDHLSIATPPPYIRDTYRYLRENGIGKHISVDLTQLTHEDAISMLTGAGIEIKKYLFTISKIDYCDEENKVMLVDLENPEETVNFQILLDLRTFGGIALKLNKTIAFSKIIEGKIKPNGSTIVSLVDENELEGDK